MTEVKKDTAPLDPAKSAPKPAPQERRVVLPTGESSPEATKGAIDTYKKAKTQFDKARKERESKQQELAEKKSDSGAAEADIKAEPPFDVPTTYEVKSDVPWAPNITYNLLPGQKAPDNAVKVNQPSTSSKPEKSKEELELDKKKQEEEKAIMENLRLKHKQEIDTVLKEFDFSQLTDEEKKMIHANALSRWVDATKITEEDKKAALSSLWLMGKVDIAHLTPEQLEMVQQHKAKEYLKILSDSKNIAPADLEKKYPGIQDFIKNTSQMYPVWENSAFVDENGVFDQQKFFEQVKKDPSILAETIKTIKEDGFLLSGISADSKLGKALSQIISQNVDEYLDISKPNKGLVDLEHFKKLKDVLGWSYTDLLFSEKFLLWDGHELEHPRDVLMQLLEDEVSQMPRPEPGDAEAVQKYQASIESAISSNTGVSKGVAKKVMWQISRGNLSPFVRFLADLFAPIGALLAGEVGDFWRRYLHETGMGKGEASGYPGEGWTVSSAPHQGNYIENAHGSDIIGAAQKYVWVAESKDGDLISQMHQSGGLNAGPWTAWCMSFVQHVLRKDMGYTDAQIGTGKTAWAADGRKMGKHVAKEDVMPGDIALVNWAGSSGYHIWFVAWVDKAKWTYGLLWGNQGNAVTIREEKISNAREFRGFEQRKESSSPNPQLSSAQEAIASTDITKKALEWQKAGDIHGAVHCTDWVNKIYQEVTGKRVYDAKTYYNGVTKIWWGTGIGGTHAPKEQIANIREGQHLIVDHGNNGGKTHSVIALGTPDSAWRVQVVSYPNYGKPPKIETYTLWENTAAGEKRVLRIQWVGGGSSWRSVNVAPGVTPNAPSDSIGSWSDVDSLISRIKQNESGNSGPEWYATWNGGESFPSMGFAHFIWWTNTGHGNSFHDMINYITQNNSISVPEELSFLKNPNPPRDWNGLSSMQSDPKYSAITNFLSRNDVKRAGFDFIKTQRLDSMKSKLTGSNLAKFNIIAQGTKWPYILMDYINFKWEWLGDSGYWLKHVLESMPMPSDSLDAAVKFRDTASRLLASRPDSSRWIAGWNNRLDTYI